MHPFPESDDDWQEPGADLQDCSLGLSTDEMIAEVFAASVFGDPHIRGARIKVQVQNRVVILLGEVASVRARKVMRQRAWDVPGVADVCNRLSVVPPAGS
ncbi:BON domain-containing protein [Actinoplanes sp. NPDC024001]|uniref:BON domain-containing protein n=1 Tax=Actinoplanes sp. NPDC024001 TaxID=3154598 RepID=UPI0033EBCB88